MDLNDADRRLAAAVIDAGQPLPPRFRDHLFPPSDGVTLTWPGKRPVEDEFRQPFPSSPELRAVERFGPSRDGGRGWRDRLILGDNTAALRALRDGPLRAEIEAAGGLRMIYLDPPFLTGRAFPMEVPIGETARGVTVSLPAYDDGADGGLAAYLGTMLTRLRLMHGLLADDGSLWFHCDHRVSATMRLVLDEVFGPDRLVNEIVWHYGLGNPGGQRAFARKHDTILLYAKTDRYRFNRLRGEITPAMAAKYRHEDEHGRYLISYGKKYYLKGGKPHDSVWTIPTLGATDGQRNGYPTQKPEALLERIVQTSSDPGDLVADLCCGSGTLPAVAARLGRRWIACDASPRAIHTTRARLLEAGITGFDLLHIAGQPTRRPPITYTGRVLATAESMPGHIIVRLTDFMVDVDPQDEDQRGLAIRDGHLWRHRRALAPEPLTARWSDWIEHWAVAFLSPGADPAAPFTPVWWTGRFAPSRTLTLACPPLTVPVGGQVRVVVKVVDVLGAETLGEVLVG